MPALVGSLSLALLVLALALLYWHFLGYPLVMAWAGRRHSPLPAAGDPPFVSVVLPVYNEAPNLVKRVENLRSQEYPGDRVEIIIVESGSTDNTLSVARDLASRFPSVTLVEQGARLGKSSAVAAAKEVAKGSIIVVSDANTVYERGTLTSLVQPFADPAVGGVGGRFTPKNAQDVGAAGSNLYWSLEEVMRSGEAALDSCCTFHGEVYAWRRDLVDPDRTAILDDFDTAIQIRIKGHRVAYAPDALAYESVPTRMRDMETQWRKNALGAIQCIHRHFRALVRRPNLYSFLILPSHKGLQIAQPFLLLLAIVGLAGALWAGMVLEVLASVLLVGLVSLGSAALLLRVIRRVSKGAPPPLGHVVGLVRTFVAFEYAILLGWKDYVAGNRDVRWEKVESTRI